MVPAMHRSWYALGSLLFRVPDTGNLAAINRPARDLIIDYSLFSH